MSLPTGVDAREERLLPTRRSLLDRLRDWLRPPRFAKYQPAPRVGTRRIERRLLRRLNSNLAKTS